MSKYSRTRKAVCRISELSEWIVSRRMFKQNPSETWKQSYKDFRKRCVRLKNEYGLKCEYYSYLRGKYIFPPAKYKDALKHFIIWKLPL